MSRTSSVLDVLRLRFSRLEGRKRARVFGYDISYADPGSARHLLREIFVEHAYFMPLRNSAPVILDVGSNIGVATLYFKRIWSDATVLCLEPDPDTFRVLRDNIRQNGLNQVFPRNAGAGDFEGVTKLYVPFWSNGSSSIYPEKIAIESGYARGGWDVVEGPQEKEIEVLRCSKLLDKEGIGRIDLLKIDAEGAEEGIIRDLAGRLGQIDAIIIEYHYARDFLNRNALSRIIAILEDAEFLVSVTPTWQTSRPGVMATYLVRAVNGKAVHIDPSEAFAIP